MFITSFIKHPQELNYKRCYVELFKHPTRREVRYILKEYGCGRYGIVDNEVWFWRGDIFHGTVMRELWCLRLKRQWLDWDEKLYFERYGEGIIWSTNPLFHTEKHTEEIKTMEYSYLRMKEIRSGATHKTLWRKHDTTDFKI
jgi:hypothetical protein